MTFRAAHAVECSLELNGKPLHGRAFQKPSDVVAKALCFDKQG